LSGSRAGLAVLYGPAGLRKLVGALARTLAAKAKRAA
jgi:hypothetical protein